jgi:hypothetical protein
MHTQLLLNNSIEQRITQSGRRGGFSRHTIPKLHVFDQISLKNIKISKEKGHL